MTDIKTVREALECALNCLGHGHYVSAIAEIQRSLAALDRIEAVETVTFKEACDMGIDAMDASFIMEKYPNGIRIVKEK